MFEGRYNELPTKDRQAVYPFDARNRGEGPGHG